MQRLSDWIDIFAPHAGREETVTLSVSEVARLVFDLRAAQAAIPMKERSMSTGTLIEDTVIDVKCVVAGKYSRRDHRRKPGRALVYLDHHEYWVPHFDVWNILGWSRWSRRRMAAVKAAAPSTIRAIKRPNGAIYLMPADQQAWAERIQKFLGEKPEPVEEPSAADVLEDSAVVKLNSVVVAPFVIDVFA